MTTKHILTPGPWIATVYANDTYTTIENTNKRHVAAVSSKRDAALIAAAPYLLAVLQALTELCENDGRYPIACTAAHEAIAKAKVK